MKLTIKSLQPLLFIFLFLQLAVLGLPPSAFAQTYTRANGWCEQGAQTVTTSGIVSSTMVQRSYPSCTITIYDTGTTNLSTIYSTSTGTVKANPFTAATSGLWFFYAAAGTYDVRYSAGGITTPFTIAGWTLPTSNSSTGTFSNKTLDNTNIITIKDANLTIQDDAATTKQLKFQASLITAGQTRVVTVPDSNIILPIMSQVLTWLGPSASRTYTLPDAAVTLASLTGAEVFTNKILTSPTINTPTITNATSTTGTYTSPSITTDIHATVAGSPTLGTNALPFGSAYLGTAATNNVRILPAATAAAITATIDNPAIAAVKLPLMVRGTASFTAAAIGAGACGTDVTAAVTGLATTSGLIVNLSAAPDANTDNGLIWYFWPSAAQVNIRVCNPTAGSITPSGNLNFNYAAIVP